VLWLTLFSDVVMAMQRYYDYEQKHRRRTMSRCTNKRHPAVASGGICVYCQRDDLQQQVLIDDEAVSQFITAFYKAGGAPVTKKQVRAGLRAAQEKDNAQG
jgi:hypothetical protein